MQIVRGSAVRLPRRIVYINPMDPRTSWGLVISF
jgi:hypothetical protein